MKSAGTNIATMLTGVCVATLCVCAALAPNGRSTAHQLLFDYDCEVAEH